MEVKNKILWLRICYWIGAIVDGFVAIAWLFPDFWASFSNFSQHLPGIELSFAMWQGAALMFGWTALLIWADRKPVERKGILLITIFPVIFGLMLANILSVTLGLRTFEATAPILILQSILAAIFITGYVIQEKK
jgi:hypothetical protein